MGPRPVVCALSLACSEWPRHAHLPIESDALPAGTDPAEAIDVWWDRAGAESEVGDGLPELPDAIELGAGVLRYGSLLGTGWDPDTVGQVPTSCGTLSEFPPMPQGDYTGDVDWFRFRPSESGTLCARAILDQDRLMFDLVPYHEDACGEPAAPFVEPGSGDVVGFDEFREGTGDWGIAIDPEEDAEVAVALVGWHPDSEEAVPWRLGVSLVETTDQGDAGLCPSLPEELAEGVPE